MGDKLMTNIINSVERVLRYLIPGVTFWLLFALSYPTDFDEVFKKISNNGVSVFLLILTVGMSIYVVYYLIIKFTLELFVFKMGKSPVNLFCNNDKCLCDYSKPLAKLILSKKKSRDYPEGYYTYLWSITHYSFILSILLISFAIANNEMGSWVHSNSILIGFVGGGILILSIISYCYLQVLEKHTIAILRINERGFYRFVDR